MFYIVHEDSFTMAAKPPRGSLVGPKHTTIDIAEAVAFDVWEEASDYSQNFGPEWWVEEI